MAHAGLPVHALHALDRLTDTFPHSVPRLIQPPLLAALGNPLLYSSLCARSRRVLQERGPLESMLVIADAGIGDAVILQQSLVALRRIFPPIRIDYLCNRHAGELMSQFPAADHVYGLLEGNGFASPGISDRVRKIVEATPYSLVLNFSPFLPEGLLGKSAPLLNLYVPFGSYLMRLWRTGKPVRHISQALANFLYELFETPGGPWKSQPIKNAIYLTDRAIEDSRAFLGRHHLLTAQRLVLFHPDATSRYTRIPPELQIRLLRTLVESEETNVLLIAAGYRTPDLEENLISRLPTGLRAKVIALPHLPLGVFAALVDTCDLFLSGDGGPVHVAASWKISVSGEHSLRNRTAIVTLFGATDARMYGYDSGKEGYLPAFQHAPSRVFVAPAPCRNVTCIDKLQKTCGVVRCFSGIATEEIASYSIAHLRSREPVTHSA